AINALFAVTAHAMSLLVAGDTELHQAGANLQWSNELDPAKTAPAPAWTYYNATDEDRGFLISGRTGMLVEGINGSSGFDWSTHSYPIRNWLFDVKRTPDFYVAVGDRATL